MDKVTLLKRNLGFFIDNHWESVAPKRLYHNNNPSTGEILSSIQDCNVNEVNKAITLSGQSFISWSNSLPIQRSEYLRQIANGIQQYSDLFSELISLESGKPIIQSNMEVNHAIKLFNYYSEECTRINGVIIPTNKKHSMQMTIQTPIGVVGIITPWNFPLSMLARKIAPALAAGCCAVVKPATQTPLAAIAFFELIKTIKLPNNVLNLICTSRPDVIGKCFTNNDIIRLISFTGSVAVGKILIKNSSNNIIKIILELGGNAAFVVFKDADIEDAVDGLIVSKFRHSGQVCISPNRVFLHNDISDKFLKLLIKRVSELKIGNVLNRSTDIGPLINKSAYEKVKEHIHDALKKGAKCILGGSRYINNNLSSNAYYFQPTIIIDVLQKMKIYQEETFGPIIPIMSFSDNNKVIKMVNDTKYGLAAYAYTKDITNAIEFINNVNAGVIGINNPKPASPNAPFGGFKQSGFGKEGGIMGLSEFLNVKLGSIKYK